MKRVAVFTAVIGGYDELGAPNHRELADEADFYCFSDVVHLHSGDGGSCALSCGCSLIR